VEFVYAETEAWAEFVWNGTKWLVNDNSNVLSGTFSGALTITGALTPSGGIVGKTDGVAVAAGYVGEICTTTERAGTGGSAYQDFNNTAITNTGFTKMIYKSVKKGIYIVSGQSGCYRSDSATSGELIAYLAVGDTAVSNSVYAGISSTNTGTACVNTVIKVTTDNTEIQLYTRVASGVTAASPVHGLSIVRIA
jgi:hypothetical protein